MLLRLVNTRYSYPFAILTTVFLMLAGFGQGQNCPMPQLPPASNETNMFTPAQAEILGDIVMQSVSTDYQLVNNPELNRYMQEIADRMAEVSGVGKVRLELLDIPEVNAFTFAGGRVLLSRKLVAFARTEDEFAGVLAHEFGHIVTRDMERDTSERFRRILKVSSVGDRRDIEEKYNRLIESVRKKRIGGENETEREQLIADQLAVWLMSRMGYAPHAYADMWIRINELRANDTGTWLSDLFGRTKPESKRLRTALSAASQLPATCIGSRLHTEEQFKEWQRKVTEASRTNLAQRAVLHNVVNTRKLDPPLRSEVSQLRFSPDGKWVLAQDDSSVNVLTREPFAFKFRIDAAEARNAQFSPDSSAVVFFDDNYRVERWNIASEKREWVRELVFTRTCVDTALSSDGRLVACTTIDPDDGSKLDLRVIDTATGSVAFESKSFARGPFALYLAWAMTESNTEGLGLNLSTLAFSPDCHYLLVARYNESVAVDVTKMAAISLPNTIRDRIGESFAFIGNDRIVGIHIKKPQESGVVTFPAGEVVATVSLKTGLHALDGITHGTNYFVVRPIVDYPVGLYNVSENKVVMANKRSAFDMYDEVFVSERKTGELGLYKRPGGTPPIAIATVPISPLGRLRAATITPDFKTLVASQRSRGALWDLTTGEHKPIMHGFTGAYFDANATAYLDFPVEDNLQRTIMRLPADKKVAEPLVGIFEAREFTKASADRANAPKPRSVSSSVEVVNAAMYGPYVAGWRGDNKTRDLVVFEAKTGKQLWSRHYVDEWPYYKVASSSNNALALRWSLDQTPARKMMEKDANLRAHYRAAKARLESVAFVEVLELATGKTIGKVLVDQGNGSFYFHSLDVAGDYFVFSDNQNRTVIYSLSSGNEVGHAFGAPVDVSRDGSMVMVENSPGQVTLYALPSMEKRDEMTFASGVAFARFSEDGKSAFVLTQDHTTFTIALPGAAAKMAGAGK